MCWKVGWLDLWTRYPFVVVYGGLLVAFSVVDCLKGHLVCHPASWGTCHNTDDRGKLPLIQKVTQYR